MGNPVYDPEFHASQLPTPSPKATWKLLQLVGALTAIGGTFAFAYNGQTAVVLIVLGLALFVGGRIAADFFD